MEHKEHANGAIQKESVYGRLGKPKLTSALLGLIGEGEVYSLQMTLERGMPVFGGHPPYILRPYFRHGETDGMLEGGAGFATELTMMSQHTGTHIDALCHISYERDGVRRLYGGVPIEGTQSHDGISAWSIEQMPPIVTRGVLLDVAAAKGVDTLDDSYPISRADLEEAMRLQGVEVRPGDCVLVRTGFTKYWKTDNERYLTRHAGVNEEAAAFLCELGVAVVGADTPTFEPLPAPRHPVHVLLLVEQGVPIIECLNLEELSANRAYEFLFIATPLKLKGATASMIHPLAIR